MIIKIMKKLILLLTITFLCVPGFISAEEGKKLAQKNGCFACHSIKLRVLGPSFKEISAKYRISEATKRNLMGKIKNGGSGNWGDIPMISHPKITEKDLGLMVEWILNLDR
jgi:cytochrome c|tara:strand:+ start:11635 stop:11967 length:333 start_codon:yes stop_codon:yes gene_type:complete